MTLQRVPGFPLFLRLVAKRSGEQILTELRAMGITPAPRATIRHHMSARIFKEDAVYLYLGKAEDNAVERSGTKKAPRLAWLEGHQGRGGEIVLSFLDHEWNGENTNAKYFIVLDRPLDP